MIKVTNRGSFNKTFAFLNKVKQNVEFSNLDKYGSIGVAALQAATPVDTGLARDSWYYEIEKSKGHYAIHWLNKDVENGFHVAVMVQYGHATRNGGFVQGVDYINPAMRDIFTQMANDMWKEVTK